MICTTTRALLRVNLRGAFSVCIKRMMGGRVIEENIDFYRYPICHLPSAGAIYRIDGTVLINRDIFDDYLERFHEPATGNDKEKKTDER